MDAPQIIYIVLVAISGTVYLMNNGKPMGKYNFPFWAVGAAVQIALLYWGGFFG